MEPAPVSIEIHPLTEAQAPAQVPALADLLIDAVAAGASVGYLPPLSPAAAEKYWWTVMDAVRAGERRLWAAWRGAALAGTVQLDLVQKPNGRHRAEVMKLLVHTAFRRQGLGRQLMFAVEAEARALGRTTLVLDTLAGEPSERLYQALGWQIAGQIPEFARSGDGRLYPTVIYYKLLAANA